MNPLLAVVFIYPAILVGVSLWRSRAIKSHADFMVAGRSVPVLLLVGTLVCTWVGSGSLFGGAGLAYRVGIGELWFSFGGWLGLLVAFFLAPRVRRIAQYTVPDLLEQRYSPAARLLGTLAIILAYVTIAAYQFRGGGWILTIVTDGAITPETGMYIVCITIVLFTALAGMMSIVTVDILNGIVITLGILIALPFMVAAGGGLGEVMNRLPEGHTSIMGGHNALWVFGVALPTFLLILGESGMYQKFFSAKNERAAKLAVVGWIAGTILLETLIDSVGIFGSVAIPGLTTAQSETIVISVALQVLPTLLGVLLLCGAAAIVVSTANSFLLTPATNLIRDVYQRFLNPQATDRQVLVYTRLLVVVLGILGFVAGNFFPTILAMALWAYTMYGAGITPALLAALVWPRATRAGGVTSIAVGMATTLVWEIVALRRGVDGDAVYLLGLQTVYPALFLSIAALVIVSLMTPAERRPAHG